MNASQLLPTKLGILHFINKYMWYRTLDNGLNLFIADPKQISLIILQVEILSKRNHAYIKKSLYRYHSILGRDGNILSLSGFQACQNFDVQFSVTSDKPIITIMHKAYAWLSNFDLYASIASKFHMNKNILIIGIVLFLLFTFVVYSIMQLQLSNILN